VMHRDIKPPNILVTRDDFAYLVDFGIASATTDEKLTQLGTAVGTWKYMAPERFTNAEVTYRADIYALACVLHECLTGAPPYRADSASVLISAHLMEPIPQASTERAGIPKAFDAVIARGMAKNPADRYASAGDLALAAHDALSDPDQDHLTNILRRSQEATLPGTASAILQPPPAPTFITPPPAPIQHSPPPYRDPAPSGPISGPPPSGPPPSGPVPSRSGYPNWSPTSGAIPAPSQQVPQFYQGSGSSWAGQPPGAPPPQQPPGPAPWNQPPPSGKRKLWPIIAGAAALVVLLVVAAIVIVIVNQKPDNPVADHPPTTTAPTTSIPTTTPETTTTSPENELQSRLLALLPAGYSSDICTPTTPKPNSIWVNALAMVDCKQNTNDGGPSRGVYGLFANPDVLKKAFTDDIGATDVQLVNCPGQGPSPDGWHHQSSPTVTAGQIACATFKNHPNVIWSNQAKLMLSDVFGDPPAIGDLYTWWTKYSG
jgi:serine/threonine kinase PknH